MLHPGQLLGFALACAAGILCSTRQALHGSSDDAKEHPAKKLPAIAWRKHWEDARQEARVKKQPLLLVVAFPSCKWWLRMERTTFTDKQVRDLVATTVPVLLYGEEDGRLFEQVKVSECPLIAVFDAGGKEMARIEGLQQAKPFRDWLGRHLGQATKSPK